jgi:hypothetical protein
VVVDVAELDEDEVQLRDRRKEEVHEDTPDRRDLKRQTMSKDGDLD